MQVLKKIINFLLNILLFAGVLRKKKNSLRILMFHDINDIERFDKLISYIKKHWEFITPNQFYKIYNSKNKFTNKKVLLTFDDGFKSNIKVAQTILKKHNIKAVFFVPFEFIEKKKISEKKNFIKKNLNLEYISNDQQNMNFKDIQKLLNLNHELGAHTFSHKDLKMEKNLNKLKFEIILSTNSFENKIKKKINLFAFNFGRLQNISHQMVNISKKRYKYLFTAVRGDNNKKAKMLFRDNISLKDNIFDINVYLNGLYDFIYENERKKLLKFMKTFK